MAKQLPQEMVYTITSGFYPKLFSKKGKWTKGVGGGRKGMQHLKVSGFTEGTLKKIQGKRKEEWEATPLKAFLESMKKGRPWDEAASRHLSTNDSSEDEIRARGKELGFKSQREMEQGLTWSKFMGNTDMYKLWGSRVWYQHGNVSGNREKMTNDLNNIDPEEFDNKDPTQFLTQLYKDSETDLIELAEALAKKVFGDALEEENLRKDLESIGEKADVPEEEYKELKNAEKVNSLPKKFRDVSHARQLDVKMRMKKGSSLYMDSTEMPLHQADQHGITKKAATELGEAIKKAKLKGKEGLEELRQTVVKVFIKNIEYYNKRIAKLVHRALPDEKDKKKGMGSLIKIMKKIQKQNEKAGFKNTKASVAQIGKHLGVDFGEDKAEETALKYIIHTVTNLAGKANKNFRQGHFAGVIDGQNTYASVPMRLKERRGEIIPQFMKSVVTAKPPNGVIMLQGESHAIAIAERYGILKDNETKETKARQIQAFQNGKIIGVSANNTMNAKANAEMGLSQEVRQSTVVTFNPEHLKDLLDKIPETINDNVGNERIMKRAKAYMQGHESEYQLKDFGESSKFWALPYIGLMEYPTKSE